LLTWEKKERDWKLIKEVDDEDESKIYQRKGLTKDLKAIKITTNTNCTMEQLEDILYYNYLERHSEWNDTFSSGYIIDSVEDDITVQYWRFDFGGPITSRDFVVVRRRIVNEDGSITILEKSINHGKQPKTSKLIRSNLLFQLRHFQPMPYGCILTCANETDIKGWIPKSLTNSAAATITLEELQHIKAAAVKEKEVVQFEATPEIIELVSLENKEE